MAGGGRLLATARGVTVDEKFPTLILFHFQLASGVVIELAHQYSNYTFYLTVALNLENI